MIMATINVNKLIEIAKEVVDNSNNYVNIVDIIKYLQDELKITKEVEEKELDELVEKYLDEECSNGHFSRWTHHGVQIWHEYEDAKEYYYYY